MDLQKLRPTYSQWRAPVGTTTEGRARTLQKPQAQTAAKTLLQPPKGKGNELWQRFFADAQSRGCPDPEKLADTLLRSRERALELAEARHKLVVVTTAPKPCEAAAVNKGTAAKKGRPVVHEALRCKARTLAGKQCGFKATCGEFCKKHAVEAPPVQALWHKVADRRRFSDVALRGSLNFEPAAVRRVFGEPNGVSDNSIDMEWLVRFADDTPAVLIFRRGAPSTLLVCGESVKALANVREALA
jgi:hypothetical protein